MNKHIDSLLFLMNNEDDRVLAIDNGVHQTITNNGAISNSNITGWRVEVEEARGSLFTVATNLSSEVPSLQSSSDTELPSDLSVEYHPLGTAQYRFVDPNEEEQEDSQEAEDGQDSNDNSDNDEDWSVDEINISKKCKLVKANTINLDNAPAKSLSDICLLCLNDMYLFEHELNKSTSRYFGVTAHRKIVASIQYEQYCAEAASQAWKWCSDVMTSPSVDQIASLTTCARYTTLEATASRNLVDIYTAQDTFVQSLLDPALPAVFTTNQHLKIQWANAALSEDAIMYKPDFSVATHLTNKKLKLVVTEVKPSKSHSSVKSDMVKLGRQMKQCFNEMVIAGAPSPVVCGLKFNGYRMETYALDMHAPKFYRMHKLADVNVYRDLSQFNLIPNIVSHLLQVRNIALKTAVDADRAILAANERLRRPKSTPPTSWLNCDRYVLARKRRRASEQ